MKEIILSISGTLLVISLILNAFLLHGYEFIAPVSKDEQLSIAKSIVAESIISSEKKGK